MNCDVDLYISFDNEKVGFLQADYIAKKVSKGKYFLLSGAPTDNNARLLRDGQMRALQPLIDQGNIAIVAQQWVEDWSPSVALNKTEQVLTRQNNQLDAIIASNDGTAGGAIQALETQKLEGKVAQVKTLTWQPVNESLPAHNDSV